MIIKIPASYDMAGSYQRVPDWSAVSPKPLFVVHKATEGNFYQDPSLATDFAGMLANGIYRGAYHFFRKAVNSTTQAQYFCNYVRGTLRVYDYIILDMEEGGELVGAIFAWLDEIEKQFSNEIIIYSNKSKIDALAAQCTPTQLFRLQSYKIWIAAYPINPDLYAAIPATYIPAGFTVCMWQYSSSAHPAGIVATSVDVNWLAPEFIAELTGTVTPPPNGEPMETWKIIANELNVRTGIGTSYPVITTVKKDDIIEGVLDVASNWIHISKRNGVALDGWCSGNALYVVTYVPPVPAVSPVVHASMDFDLVSKTMVTTRRRQDGTSDIERDPIA